MENFFVLFLRINPYLCSIGTMIFSIVLGQLGTPIGKRFLQVLY